MKKRLRDAIANPPVWYALAISTLLFHCWWAWKIKDWAPVARCGALWILFGMIVTGRPIVRVGYENWIQGLFRQDYGSIVPSEEEKKEKLQEKLDAVAVQILGPFLIFAGTIIWGYGDLIAAGFFGLWRSN